MIAVRRVVISASRALTTAHRKSEWSELMTAPRHYRTAGRWDLPRVSRTSSCAFLAPERGTSKSRINPSPPTGGAAIVVLVDQVVACGDFVVKRDARRATRCGYPLRRTGATTTRLAVWAKNHLFANSTSTR